MCIYVRKLVGEYLLPLYGLLTDCPVISPRGRAVRCWWARKHFLVGSRYARKPNPTLTLTLKLIPNRTQKRETRLRHLRKVFIIPDLRTTISPLPLLVKVNTTRRNPSSTQIHEEKLWAKDISTETLKVTTGRKSEVPTLPWLETHINTIDFEPPTLGHRHSRRAYYGT